MNILVTGSNGFIGSAIVERLIRSDHKVYCYIREESSRKPFLNLVTYITYEDVFKNVDLNIECIIHTAWGSTRGSDRNNDDLQKKNLEFTHMIAEIASFLKVKQFIAFGSQAEYGHINKIIQDDTEFHPNTAYGKYKVKSKEYMERFFREENISFVWFRLFSLYGPKDYEESLIMTTIQKLEKNEDIALTECTHYWDFLYIDDLIDLVILALSKTDIIGDFNVAYGESRPLKEYIVEIQKLLSSRGKLEFGKILYTEFNNYNLSVNTEKIRTIYDWNPKICFIDGINKIIKNF